MKCFLRVQILSSNVSSGIQIHNFIEIQYIFHVFDKDSIIAYTVVYEYKISLWVI